MEYSTPKGTRDFLPEEMEMRNYVISKIESWFKKYGYSNVETPAFEYLEVLTKKSGEVENEIYSFKDKAGRKLGLRFDLTVPLARLIASNPTIKKPFKRYCISRVWRYENPQLGRFREFWQADADIVGAKSMDCEIELLSMATKICEDLGFKRYRIHLNNRKILEGFANLAGINGANISKALRILDKLDKIGYEGVEQEFLSKGFSKKEISMFMSNIKSEGSNSDKMRYLAKLFASHPKALEGVNELNIILSAMNNLGLEQDILIDLTLVRGLDYYSGPIFEIKSQELKIGSFSGGGRYDNLIELYSSTPTPAVGISFGLERIIEILKSNLSKKKQLKLLVAYVNNNVKMDAIKIADSIRNSLDIPIETDLAGRSLRNQLDYANSRNIRYVIIVGETELQNKKFKLKDMINKTEDEISLNEVVERLKRENKE